MGLKSLLKPYKKPLNAAFFTELTAFFLSLFAFWFLSRFFMQREGILLIIVLSLWSLKSLILWLKNRILQEISQNLRKELRVKILEKIALIGLEKSKIAADAGISTIILEEIDSLDRYLKTYAITQKLSLIAPLVIIFSSAFFSLKIAFSFLIIFCLIPPVMVILGRKAGLKNRQLLQKLEELNSHFLDLIRGRNTIRRLNGDLWATEIIKKSSLSYRDKTMEVLKLAFLSTAALEFFAALSLALIAILLGFSFFNGENLQLVLFLMLITPEFLAPLLRLGADYHAKAQAEAAALKILEFLDIPDFAKNLKNVANLGEISLKIHNLTVKNQERIRIKNFSCEINSGERILLRGSSGAGKSTILQTLAGFCDFEGELFINGEKFLRGDLINFRQNLAYLGQNSPILQGTVEKNLKLAKNNATETELLEVLEKVGLGDFIKNLPLGLKTPLGERGEGFSGGQLQRLSLAQMLLADANLWLLDEPTSQLDMETALEIDTVLEKITRGKSLILVSHNANLGFWVDKIVKINQ